MWSAFPMFSLSVNISVTGETSNLPSANWLYFWGQSEKSQKREGGIIFPELAFLKLLPSISSQFLRDLSGKQTNKQTGISQCCPTAIFLAFESNQTALLSLHPDPAQGKGKRRRHTLTLQCCLCSAGHWSKSLQPTFQYVLTCFQQHATPAVCLAVLFHMM